MRQVWDSNGDGFISPEEFRTHFAHIAALSDAQLADIVSVMDQDGDGQVHTQNATRAHEAWPHASAARSVHSDPTCRRAPAFVVNSR